MRPPRPLLLPRLFSAQHNGLIGAGRSETVATAGRNARLESFLRKSKWASTTPSVNVSSSTETRVKKDSVKEADKKTVKKTAPMLAKVSRKNKLKCTEWRLAVARAALTWSQSTKASVDEAHDEVMQTAACDEAVTNLPVGDRGWGKAFALPRITLPEEVLSQLRALYVASKISPEAAAAEVHRTHPGNVRVKYHCTSARVKTFFAQLTKAKKQNKDLDLVGLHTDLEGRAAESNASLTRELEERGLKTSGKKSVLVERLDRSDESKSLISDYNPNQLPGNGSKTAAHLKAALTRAGLSTAGVKKTLVKRLNDYEEKTAREAAEKDKGESPDVASDGLLDTTEREEDESDQLAAVACDAAGNDDDEDNPENLSPEDFGGVDNEDLTERYH